MPIIFHGNYSTMLIAFATFIVVTAAAPGQLAKKSNNEDFSNENLNLLCETRDCVQAASTILKRMDQNVSPCSNFYQFACGKFIEDIDDIPETPFGFTLKMIRDLSDNIKKEDLRYFKSMKLFYQSCKNTETTASNDENELKEVLEKLGGWPILKGSTWNEENFDWKKLVSESSKMGYEDIFLRFFVDIDTYDDTDEFVFQIDPKVRRTSTDIYNGKLPVIETYLKYMTDIAKILGADVEVAKYDLANLLDFELKLNNISDADPEIKKITIKEMDTMYSNVSWAEFINEIIAPHAHVHENEKIILYFPNYLKGLLEIIENTPKRVLANYAMWRIIQWSIPVAKGRLSDAVDNFLRSRHSRKGCLHLLEDSFPEGTTALFISRYFDKSSQREVENLVENVNASLHDMIEQADWMDSEAKSRMFDMLNSIGGDIGYPDFYLDNNKLNEFYENLTVHPENFFKFMASLNRFNMVKRFSNLGKTVKIVGTHSYNGVVRGKFVRYNYENNKLVVPGEILHRFFSDMRPNYLNYGVLGWLVGRETTGALRYLEDYYYATHESSLKNETKEKYTEKENCLVKQYDNYTVKKLNIAVKGNLTLQTNLLDNAGLKAAYLAYDKLAKKNDPELQLPELNYTPRQMFWISAASTLCGKTESSDYAPAEFRVIGSISNMPEFSRDFNCPLETPMNPTSKCVVW